ncbi:MAG: type II toxin-antitoxin system VapC family toxin [Pseudomonadota bacterium]
MQLLLDTQIFIWPVMDSKKLGTEARQIILNAVKVFVSAASVWEIAIKTKIGKLEGEPKEFAAAIAKSGFSELPISAYHATMVYELPLYHRDPFDRMLIAQALAEPLRILTADRMLSQYSELVITV